MENIKNYYNYFINTKIWRESQKIKIINELLKAKKQDIINMEDWEKNRKSEYLTETQAKALKNGDTKKLKALLIKYKEKAKKQLKKAKEDANKEYNNIKQLKDIKRATFEIVWSKNRGVYGYQCKCYSKIEYKNGQYDYYEGESTSGCGYDKPSSALSYNMNKTSKILLIKNGNKIIKDDNKHYNCYVCENLYFSYGVGINSYLTMFKYFGFKTNVIYHQSEDITITIEK